MFNRKTRVGRRHAWKQVGHILLGLLVLVPLGVFFVWGSKKLQGLYWGFLMIAAGVAMAARAGSALADPSTDPDYVPEGSPDTWTPPTPDEVARLMGRSSAGPELSRDRPLDVSKQEPTDS
jgi:hypothetical protein